MFIEIKKVETSFKRLSKLGVEHSYSRLRSVGVFKCDNCDSLFQRDIGKMDYRRLNDIYSHVCANCNQKSFAQKKGVERRRLWNMPASSDLDISKL